jgi:hypothetical protein
MSSSALSNSLSLIDLIVASKNSPRVGRISMGVVPRSDLTSNFATDTPSLSVGDEKVIPSKTVDTLSFFNARISGGATTRDGTMTPLDDPCLWTILTCLNVPESVLLKDQKPGQMLNIQSGPSFSVICYLRYSLVLNMHL